MEPSKVAYYNCSYLPEELAMQAGFIPKRLLAHASSTRKADRYLPANLCSYTRLFLQEACEEQDAIFLLADCCDSVRRLYDALEQNSPGRAFLLYLPRSEEYCSYFSEELGRLWLFLKKKGLEAKESDLFLEIEKGEKRRAHLRDFYLKVKESKISPLFYYRTLMAFSQFQDLPNLSQEDKGRREGKKVFLVGNSLDQEEIWRVLEELNLVIVGDDLCYGERQAEMIRKEGEDPFSILSQMYLSRPLCPRMKDVQKRIGDLLKKFKERQVEAVIFLPLKYCDSLSYDLPLFREALKREGISYLNLEQDYTTKTTEQIRTRVEALLEEA